ncbi:MAG: hypothetical protein ACTS73_02460 [Arsenophonus sp. NEOnobi-MAG3]
MVGIYQLRFTRISLHAAVAETVYDAITVSYFHFWCMGFRRWWYLWMIDFINYFNKLRIKCHEKSLPDVSPKSNITSYALHELIRNDIM